MSEPPLPDGCGRAEVVRPRILPELVFTAEPVPGASPAEVLRPRMLPELVFDMLDPESPVRPPTPAACRLAGQLASAISQASPDARRQFLTDLFNDVRHRVRAFDPATADLLTLPPK